MGLKDWSVFASNLAKAFEIPAMSGLSGIPSTVVQAALGGKHSPIVPQRQRLLVAAKKTPDTPAANAAAAAAAAKAKPAATKHNKAAAKPKAGAKAKDNNHKDKESKGSRAPYADTEYNIQRKAFFATFLI